MTDLEDGYREVSERDRIIGEGRAVDRFAERMRARLSQKAREHSYGPCEWRRASTEDLVRHLREEVEELVERVDREDGASLVEMEALDVANLALMVSDVYRIEVMGR